MYNFKKSLCFEVDNEKRVQIIIQKTNFHIWLFFWHQNDYEDRSFKLLFPKIGPQGPSGLILEFLWQFFVLFSFRLKLFNVKVWYSDPVCYSEVYYSDHHWACAFKISPKQVVLFSWIEVRLLKNYTLGIQIQCLNGKQQTYANRVE